MRNPNRRKPPNFSADPGKVRLIPQSGLSCQPTFGELGYPSAGPSPTGEGLFGSVR